MNYLDIESGVQKYLCPSGLEELKMDGTIEPGDIVEVVNHPLEGRKGVYVEYMSDIMMHRVNHEAPVDGKTTLGFFNKWELIKLKTDS